MTVPVVALGILMLAVGAEILPPVFKLCRRPGREAGGAILAALAFALGAVPMVRIAMFRSMMGKDYSWAIRGPAPFDQLGGGAWWFWTLVVSVAARSILWGIGFRILAGSRSGDADRSR